jgi:hypothetical protein
MAALVAWALSLMALFSLLQLASRRAESAMAVVVMDVSFIVMS